MAAETFFELLRSPGHWLFELFLMAVFDGVVGFLIWPRVREHIHRDVKHAERHVEHAHVNPDDDVHKEEEAPRMADEAKKDAVGNLGLSGYIKVYSSSRSVGTVLKKSAKGAPAVMTGEKEIVRIAKTGTNEAGIAMFGWVTPTKVVDE